VKLWSCSASSRLLRLRRARRPGTGSHSHATLGAACALAVTAATARAAATDYFVDDQAGSDGNTGTSQANAWQTTGRVSSATLLPGDSVSFRRGGQWAEQLHIVQSGTADAPITFGAWGSGPAPVLQATPGDPSGRCVSVEAAAYVVIRDLMLKTAPDAGIALWQGEHVVVTDCELTDLGFGVSVEGTNDVVQRSYVHDLHMVNNTVGGDDDYGAVGVVLSGSGHEVAYNRFVNCIAPSYDYGTDGGAVEFWATVTGCNIHHNIADNTDGFAEIGGQAGDVNHDNVLAYNLAHSTRGFGWYHIGGTFAIDLAGLRIENNTIVDDNQSWTIFGFTDTETVTPEMASIRNNVVWTDGALISNKGELTHDHNLFWLAAGGDVGFTLGDGEQVADPSFVDAASADFHLQPSSPAIDQGVALGYGADLDGHPVPQGAAPDLGAYEWGDALGGAGGGGSGGSGTGGTGPGAAGGSAGQSPVGGTSAAAPAAANEEGGCGCRLGASRSRSTGLLGLGWLGMSLCFRRRRPVRT
jgi:hypothetical protein